MLPRFEEFITPVDRGHERAVTGHRVAAACPQQVEVESRPQPLDQLFRLEYPGARRDQFDRERDPVQMPADVGDGGRVVSGQGERWVDRAGALDEELDRLA